MDIIPFFYFFKRKSENVSDYHKCFDLYNLKFFSKGLSHANSYIGHLDQKQIKFFLFTSNFVVDGLLFTDTLGDKKVVSSVGLTGEVYSPILQRTKESLLHPLQLRRIRTNPVDKKH